ncbi:MAG: DivIVA domain-containing protein [Ruminococcus sp.]
MISASEIHELRFEKAAFGYKQEDIDEFLNKLEKKLQSPSENWMTATTKFRFWQTRYGNIRVMKMH